MDPGSAPRAALAARPALTLAAPTQVWSRPDGQVRAGGLSGVFHGDRRLLSPARARGRRAPSRPRSATTPRPGDEHSFVAVPRHLGDGGADPTVRVVRRRDVEPGLVRETLPGLQHRGRARHLRARPAHRRRPGADGRREVGCAGARRRPGGVGGHVLTWQRRRRARGAATARRPHPRGGRRRARRVDRRPSRPARRDPRAADDARRRPRPP